MKLYEEGMPVSIDYGGTRYYGITLPPVDGSTRIYYRGDSGKLYYFPEEWREEASVRKNSKAYEYVKLHAKIIEIESSASILGQQQRKEEHKGSVLRVVMYERNADNNFDILTLRSSRNDGVYIKMLIKDLRFIYPVISIDRAIKVCFEKNDKIICIKTDSAKTYNPGEAYKVVTIVRSGHDSDFDVLVAENNTKSIAGYAKHFKRKK